MNWVEAVWIAVSAASLTLGPIHLFVWFEHQAQFTHLLLFALALSATTFGGFESRDDAGAVPGRLRRHTWACPSIRT